MSKRLPTITQYILVLQAGLAKKSFFFGHLFFNITNVFCAKKRVWHACRYMPQHGHWLASFEVIPPPKKVSFPAAKKMKIPH